MTSPHKRNRRKVSKDGRNSEHQYWNLPYTMIQSPAYKLLSGAALKVLHELRSRFNGFNNGKIFLSYEDAASQLAISSVTEFEIYSGAASSQLTFWNELLSEIIVLPFDSKAAHIAAEIQQELKKIRKTVEKADLFIAATAISNNLSLDTLRTCNEIRFTI